MRNIVSHINELYTIIKNFILKNSLYILILLTLVTTSCKPLSKITDKTYQIENITKKEFQKLNGIYSNTSDTITGKLNHFPYDGQSDYERLIILSQLFQYFPETAWRDENGKRINPKEKWIKIEFQSKKKATVSMYHNDNFVFSKNIHGKFKNGHFYLRPKVFVIPLFPLAFAYNFERARIGKTMEDNLIIEYTVNRWGFALVAGSSDRGATSSIYKKKNK